MRSLVFLLFGLLLVCPVRAEDVSRDATFVTLGTAGGPMPRVKRSGPANAVVVGKEVYLFDVGPGTVRQLAAAGLATFRIRAIFLSHDHVDHIGDLFPLLGTRWVAGRQEAIPVYGPAGTKLLVADTLKALAVLDNAPVTNEPNVAGKSVRSAAVGNDIEVMPDPGFVYADENVRVEAIDVEHFHLLNPPGGAQPRSLAFRIAAGGRSFTYTGDTGPTERLVRLARGSDILISEVVDLDLVRAMLFRTFSGNAAAIDPIMAHMRQDHLTSEQVGRIAAAAGVKSVVLTHLVPGTDQDNPAIYSRGVERIFRGRVVVANDLDRF